MAACEPNLAAGLKTKWNSRIIGAMPGDPAASGARNNQRRCDRYARTAKRARSRPGARDARIYPGARLAQRPVTPTD